MTSKQETALAKVDNYLALQADGGDVAEILKGNLGGTTLTPFDLDRVTVPTGGGQTWEITDLDEGSVAVKALTGIILHAAPARSYWATGLDEGGAPQPPDCISYDLVRGIGNPGGDCGTCQFNEWNSDPKGARGKACGERRFLFMLRPDSYLPLVVQVPPSSIKAVNQYFLRLAGKGTPYHAVVTSLGLEKTTQAGGGLAYSRVVPSLAGRLSPQDMAKVKSIADALKPMFGQAAQRLTQEAPEAFLNDE
jgi:hypothetical protein